MKLSYYHQALIVAAVGIFYTNVPRYFYAAYGTALAAPKNWLMLFCLLSLPVLVIGNTTWNTLRSPVIIWCFGYTWLTLLWVFPSSQSDVVWQEVRLRLIAILEIALYVMIFLKPNAVQLARKTLVIAVLIGVALSIYELFYPRSFSSVLGRSAGLYINPGMAGEALVLGMVLSSTVLPQRYRGFFILVVGIGILTTLSRSAIVAWIVALAGLVFVGKLSLKYLLLSGALCLLLVSIVLMPRWDQLYTTWERTGVVNANVQERLEWFGDPVGVSDLSSWERMYVAQRVWNRISEHPIMGSGTGTSGEAIVLPHNQYLSFMQDHGVSGVLILPLLILAAIWGARGESRLVGIVFACTMMVLSFFTHTILTDSYSLILLSLMAAMAATSGHREIQTTVAMDMIISGKTSQAWVRP